MRVVFILTFTTIWAIILFGIHVLKDSSVFDKIENDRGNVNANEERRDNCDLIELPSEITEKMYNDRILWRWKVLEKVTWVIDSNKKLKASDDATHGLSEWSHKRFDVLGPIGECEGSEAFGVGDSEKILCNIPKNDRECVIVSLGSNNDWRFEQDVFKKTKCSVHTFDCFRIGQPPKEISSRVFAHKVCIGTEDKGNFKTWRSILKELKLSRAPSALKMDIEGFEWEVLPAIFQDDYLLPVQIAVELHFQTIEDPVWKRRFKSEGEIALWADFMFLNGYVLLSRSDNPYGPHCSELLLGRIKCTNRPKMTAFSRRKKGEVIWELPNEWAGGLGDRITGIISAKIFAQRLNYTFAISWSSPNITGSAQIIPLYKPSSETRRKRSAKVSFINHGDLARKWAGSVYNSFKSGDDIPEKFHIAANQQFHSALWKKEEREEFYKASIERYIEFFEKIFIPDKRIMDSVNKMSKSVRSKKTSFIIMHFRIGDWQMHNPSEKESIEKIGKEVDTFINAVKKHNALKYCETEHCTLMVIGSTKLNTVVSYVSKALPKINVIAPDRKIEGWVHFEHSTITKKDKFFDILREVLIMKEADVLIIPNISNFARVGALIGKRKQTIWLYSQFGEIKMKKVERFELLEKLQENQRDWKEGSNKILYEFNDDL